MLWNETRQDQDMLRWYRRLLQLRREMPQLLLDRPVAEEARDEEGLILRKYPIEGRDVTLLFHAKEGSVCIPELAGSWDLLAEQGFDGVIHGIGAMVLAQNR
jgi:hypothetical protein